MLIRARFARLLGAVALLAGVAPAAGAQVIRGQVWSADGSPTAGLRVAVYGDAQVDSASTDSAGRFVVPLSAREGDSVRVVVDAAEPAARVFHPSVAGLRRSEWDDEVRMILVPRRWGIATGAHAGDTVDVSVARGFAPPCRGCRSGLFQKTGSSRGVTRTSSVPAWRPGSFPLRVAFDHEYSSEAISGRDSVAFWRDVADLEAELGMHLFRPASAASTGPLGDGPDDVVLVWVERGMRAAGLGSVSYLGGGDITYGTVRIHDASAFITPDAPALVPHEMIHTLGLGHTCAWYSVMADVTRCPAQRASAPTSTDVAYVQLHLAMGALQRQHRARWALDAALRGEEEIENAAAPGAYASAP